MSRCWELKREFGLKTTRIVHWAVASFLSTVVLLYLGLIGLGQWYADEYDDFAMLADHGWRAILTRIHWSPRPVSEFLFLTYGSLVNRLHDPLIVPFLAVLWAGFLIAGMLTCLGIRWNHPEEDFWPDLLVALALMAFSVAYGPIMEVFYWPAGAAAYLPTLSATLLLFLQVVRGRLATSSGRGLCSACLLVAACSSETGASLVASYALILAIQSAIAIRRDRNTSGRRFPGWWLIPGVISVSLAWGCPVISLQRRRTAYQRGVVSLGAPVSQPPGRRKRTSAGDARTNCTLARLVRSRFDSAIGIAAGGWCKPMLVTPRTVAKNHPLANRHALGGLSAWLSAHHCCLGIAFRSSLLPAARSDPALLDSHESNRLRNCPAQLVCRDLLSQSQSVAVDRANPALLRCLCRMARKSTIQGVQVLRGS